MYKLDHETGSAYCGGYWDCLWYFILNTLEFNDEKRPKVLGWYAETPGWRQIIEIIDALQEDYFGKDAPQKGKKK